MTTTTSRISTATTATTATDRFLDAARGDHGAVPWADDITLDATIPNGRLTIQGADRVDAQFRIWFADPGTLEEVRRFPIATGELVEFTVSWVEDGVPHAARQVHVLDIDDRGRITHDNMWCGGRWPARLLAQMEAARDAD